MQRGDIGPHCAGEDSAPWHLTADKVLQLPLKATAAFWILKGRSRFVSPAIVPEMLVDTS